MEWEKENFIFNTNKKDTENNGNFDVRDTLYFYCKTDKKDYPLIDYYGDTILVVDNRSIGIDLEAYLEEVDSFYVLSESEECNFKKDKKIGTNTKNKKKKSTTKSKTGKSFLKTEKIYF